MTTEIGNHLAAPKCPKTGLTLPLSKFLGSQALAEHRAMIAIELEVLARKFDRFGWDRDRGSMAHDRLILDWMDALQDYPLDEVKAGCRAAVEANPDRMPNEGHVLNQINEVRRKQMLSRAFRENMARKRAAAQEIMEQAGFARRMVKE
jgi:hypothetical protein